MHRVLVVAARLALLLATALSAAPRRPEPGIARVGFVFSQSGPAGVYGASQRRGTELAIETLNAAAGPSEPRLEPLLRDDRGDPAEGEKLFKKLSRSEKVLAIVGPTLSGTAFAADPIAQHDGLPVLAVSNTAAGVTAIGDFIFRDSLTEAVVIPGAVQTIHAATPLGSAALIYQTADAYTLGAAQAFRDAALSVGIPLLTEQTFAAGDTDFSAQLTAIRNLAPSAVFIASFAAQGAAIVRQVRDLGFPASTVLVGGNGLNSPAFLQLGGSAAEGVFVGAAWNAQEPSAASQAFVAAYQQRFGSTPDQFAAQAYAGVQILWEALRSAPRLEREAVRDALAAIHDLPTVLGSFSFTDGRDAQHPPVVQVVQGGAFALYP